MTIMTDENAEILIGCITVQMGKWNPKAVAKGSIVKNCGTCGIEVYFAPTSVKFLEENPKANLICSTCLKKKVTPEIADKVTIQPIPGAIEEALKNRQ